MVSAIPRQLATIQVPSARPPVCTHQSPHRLSALASVSATPESNITQTFVQKGFGAWDLTSDVRPVFYVFSVAPDQFPNQARTHNDGLILVPGFWSGNPSAVLLIS